MNFEEQLSKYLSGEMTPDEMAAFEKAWSEHPERDESVRRHPGLDRVFEQLVEEDAAAQLRAFQNEKDENDFATVSKGQWGGVGGRFGKKIGEIIDLPPKAIEGFSKQLKW